MESASHSSPSIGLVGMFLLIITLLELPGMPPNLTRGGGIMCSQVKKSDNRAMQTGKVNIAASLVSATASLISVSSPAIALVDERMSTEGTGLTLGLSNNILGWILVGVFGLIWSLYFVYASTLDEDDDSGLSL